tara:strand:- start:7692 stop:7823 length:132 start_codon:yes stop_codon:yes gene_type:complete
MRKIKLDSLTNASDYKKVSSSFMHVFSLKLKAQIRLGFSFWQK